MNDLFKNINCYVSGFLFEPLSSCIIIESIKEHVLVIVNTIDMVVINQSIYITGLRAPY